MAIHSSGCQLAMYQANKHPLLSGTTGKAYLGKGLFSKVKSVKFSSKTGSYRSRKRRRRVPPAEQVRIK
jgi:hypothetical protein